MKKISVVSPYNGESYPEDVARIVRIFADHGLDCSRKQAVMLWQLYSNQLCAGWLSMQCHDDALLFADLEPFFEVENA